MPRPDRGRCRRAAARFSGRSAGQQPGGEPVDGMTEHLAGVGRWPDVPGYDIGRRIGGSEYASVYEATQQDVGAPVALKVLEVAAGEHARARFSHESQV